MSDKMTPAELFDRTSVAADRIRALVHQAEDVFWEALAKSSPEITTGDIPPEAAVAFTKACEVAAAAWFENNAPKRWEHEGDLEGFVAKLPGVNGWEANYEHPGYISWTWSQGGGKFEVHATPDWDGEYDDPKDAGDIAISVLSTSDRGGTVHGEIVSWPFEGRTVENYRDLIAPILDAYAPRHSASTGLRVEMRPPRAGEIGYYVRARDASDALIEVIKEAEKEGEIGWIAQKDIEPGPDDDGLIPVTISLGKVWT